ncbi:hypothetical protein P4B35_05980 [Pontiellaceae bacterium B12227]|nr:hypothetical protein [Pontiellaceae bacterium B12227]
MRKTAIVTTIITLLGGVVASHGAEVLMTIDTPTNNVSNNARFRVDQLGKGWYKDSTSLWGITDNVLSNPGTTPGIPAEGPVGQSVSTASLTPGLDQIKVSFDYSVGAGSTLYFHLVGLTTNGAPSSNEILANCQPQNGSTQNQSETDFGDLNILNGGDPNGGTGGAVSFAATSGTYSATFNVTNYAWSADESPGLTGNIADVKDFEIILAMFASNVTTNDGSGAISISNLSIVADSDNTSLTVTPEELSMILLEGETAVTGSVDVAYVAPTNVDIAVSISDESHPGSFSLLSATPQTLTGPTTLEFEYDNTVSNLTGTVATGLVTIAWNAVGSTTTNEVVIPISTVVGFAPNANNTFTKTLGTWGDPDNWLLDRVPGSLGADRAIIQQAGRVCNVETNFTGLFPFRAWIRTSSGTPSVLNINADLKGMADISVGQATSQYGILNHTAGAVEAASIIVAHSAGTAPSNSVYTQTGGSAEANSLTVNPTGELNMDGGTMTVETGITIKSNGVVNVDGGELELPGTPDVSGDGIVKLQSGSFSAGNNSSGGATFKGHIEISGGTFSWLNQVLCSAGSSITVNGDAASITMRHIQTTDAYGSFDLTLNYNLNETGVSTINMTSWMMLQKTKINVDGSAYTGGPQTILLIDGGSLDGAAASSNITVTGFAEGYNAAVTQDGVGNGDVILTITVGGPEIGMDMASGGPVMISWPAEYGSAYNVMTNSDLVNGSWGDADWTPFLDGDFYKATNSIGSEPQLFYRLEAE